MRTKRWSRYLTALWLAAAILLASQTSAHVGHAHGGHVDSHAAAEHAHDGRVLDALHAHESQLAAPCLLCRLGGGIAPAPTAAQLPPLTAPATIARATCVDVSHTSLLLGSSGPRGPPIRV